MKRTLKKAFASCTLIVLSTLILHSTAHAEGGSKTPITTQCGCEPIIWK